MEAGKSQVLGHPWIHKKSKDNLGFMTPCLRVKGLGRKKEKEKRRARFPAKGEAAGIDENTLPSLLVTLI